MRASCSASIARLRYRVAPASDDPWRVCLGQRARAITSIVPRDHRGSMNRAAVSPDGGIKVKPDQGGVARCDLFLDGSSEGGRRASDNDESRYPEKPLKTVSAQSANHGFHPRLSLMNFPLVERRIKPIQGGATLLKLAGRDLLIKTRPGNRMAQIRPHRVSRRCLVLIWVNGSVDVLAIELQRIQDTHPIGFRLISRLFHVQFRPHWIVDIRN
jgi:hypothetical protein